MVSSVIFIMAKCSNNERRYFDDGNLFHTRCVTLTLETQTIQIGRSMILTCTVHGISKINTDVARQFAKGNNGDLLCFNGHIKQTRKYEEILSEGNTFSLKINNVTESDVNSIYQCRYKFSTVKQMININDMNFEYGPTENTTVIEFNEYDNKNFQIQINFTKIFPVPKCSAQTKTSQLNFINTSVIEERIFYKVSFLLKHSIDGQCGTDLEIYCRIGRSNHYIKTFQPFIKCSIMCTMFITLTTTAFIIILLLALVIVYKKREKLKSCIRYEGKPKSHNTKEEPSMALMNNISNRENHPKPSDIQIKEG
ncbi:unnamed protein product [Mytilus coruscus]|uniref:Ig-like domain-containing protein n=1 Tax=Mytilus coruscus TaxID=42192 RepID=A0A6J8CTS4_MYTCO|nr:unnamed protein product [Mytilus coruscus]